MKISRQIKLMIISIWLLAASALAFAGIGILARFADDVILENLEVGRSYNLREKGNLPYHVTNAGSAPVDVLIEVIIPGEKRLKANYEPIPDPGWVRVVPNKFRLDPGESGVSEIIITIPDKEEYIGRNFQTYLHAHTVGTGFMAAGAGHRLRFSTGVGPDTLAAEKKKKKMMDLNLDFRPGSIYLDGVEPGKKFKPDKTKRIKLINWAGSPIKVKLQSVDYERRFKMPPGYETAPDPSWLMIKPDVIKLKGNEIRELKCYFNIPDEDEYYGKKYGFLIKADIVDADIVLELYSRIYLATKKKDEGKEEEK